ncbi:lim domain protein [Pelomyxa schiedti]|nr:lim domain protein [Pelomyxa schiedti]
MSSEPQSGATVDVPENDATRGKWNVGGTANPSTVAARRRSVQAHQPPAVLFNAGGHRGTPATPAESPPVVKKKVELASIEVAIKDLDQLQHNLTQFYQATRKQLSSQQSWIEEAGNAARWASDLSADSSKSEYFPTTTDITSTFIEAANTAKQFHANFLPRLKVSLSELGAMETFSAKNIQLHKAMWQGVQLPKDTYETANAKLLAAQKKGKSVDLAKLAEAQQERETSYAAYSKSYDEVYDEGLGLANRTIATALIQLCNNFDGFLDSLKNSVQAMEEIKSQIQIWRQLAKEKLAEVSHKPPEETILPKIPREEVSNVDVSWQRFITKEKEYCESLKTINQNYLANILKDGSLFSEITKEQVGIIFCNVRHIMDFHTALVIGLSSPNPASVFMEELPKLCELYAGYISNFVDAQHTLSTCQSSSKVFSRVIKELDGKSLKGDLRTLLSAPLTRVRDYYLFFENYSTEIGETDPILQGVETLHELSELADMARFTHQTALVSSNVIGWPDAYPVPPGRRFIMQASLVSKEHGAVRVMLFSDILVISKQVTVKSSIKLHFITSTPLQTLSIKEIPDISASMHYCLQIADPQTLMQFATENDVIRQEIITQTSKARAKGLQKKVFHVTLKELMTTKREEGRDVPSLVESAVSYLEQTALSVEGLFRVSGDANQIEKLQTKVEEEEIALSFEGMDPHLVSGILKRFIRCLPEPVLTYAMQPDFIRCGEETDVDLRVKQLSQLVTALPTEHKNILQYLTKFFYAISLNESENKMNAKNLAIVFAPHFLRSKTVEDFRITSGASFIVVQTLIDYYPTIFQNIENQRNDASKRMKGAILRRSVTKVGDMSEFQDVESPKDDSGLILSLSEIVKQGFLSKKGSQRRNWTNRWFVLKKNYLYYFKTNKDRVPKGVINIQGCDVRQGESANKQYSFNLTASDGRIYIIATQTNDDCLAWVKAIISCSQSTATPSVPIPASTTPMISFTPPLSTTPSTPPTTATVSVSSSPTPPIPSTTPVNNNASNTPPLPHHNADSGGDTTDATTAKPKPVIISSGNSSLRVAPVKPPHPISSISFTALLHKEDSQTSHSTGSDSDRQARPKPPSPNTQQASTPQTPHSTPASATTAAPALPPRNSTPTPPPPQSQPQTTTAQLELSSSTTSSPLSSRGPIPSKALPKWPPTSSS